MTVEQREPANGAANGSPGDRSAPAPVPPLGRTALWLAKHVEQALAEVELSLPQYRLLCLLDRGSAVSSALAERLAVRPPSVTAVVDGLVARGLVERHHSEDDRRRVSHVLTPAGRRLLARADRSTSARLTAVAGSLDDEARTERAVAGLAVWTEAMAAYRTRQHQGR